MIRTLDRLDYVNLQVHRLDVHIMREVQLLRAID